jgi:hypothetical protein
MKKLLIAIACVVVLGGAGGGYVLKHNADIKHARQQRATERRERAKQRANRIYRARIADWQRAMTDWKSKQTAYQKCKDGTDEAFSAMDDINGKVTGGLNYNEYSTAVGTVVSAVSRAIRTTTANCPSVTLKLATASDQYASAARIWRTWYNDPVGSIDDLPLQPYWTKADNAVGDAQTALIDLEPGPAPDKPSRQSPSAPASVSS